MKLFIVKAEAMYGGGVALLAAQSLEEARPPAESWAHSIDQWVIDLSEVEGASIERGAGIIDGDDHSE